MAERIQVLDQKVRAVCPIDGLARLANGSVRVDFKPEATTQQREAAQALADAFDFAPRKPRRLYDIWQQLNGLTAAQQTNVWTDITGGTPPRWALDAGRNGAGIMALHWSAVNSGATAANLNDARRRLVAMYVQDNPEYLINPAFDPSINIPGDELA